MDKIRNFEEKNCFVNCLLDSLGTGWQTLAQGSLKEFSISCPLCVEAGEADCVYFISPLFFVLPKHFFMRHHGKMSKTQKKCSRTKSFTGSFQKKYHKFFGSLLTKNRFWVVNSLIQIYESGEQWEGSRSGLKKLWVKCMVVSF